jgi:pyruvate formate lyase activating enzyme
MLLSEVMDIVKRDEIYYSESGGGVTVSGGEPLLQPDFVKALVKECQRFKYSVYIDTNGHADSERFESVVNGADGVLFDLKLIDNQKHLKYTGVENDLIQKNFNNVCKMSKDHIARYVIIPGINDTEEDLSMLSDFLKETDFSGTLELLAYHKLGVKKYKSMGLDYKLSNISTPSEQEMENIKEDFINAGIKTVYR